MIYLMVFKLTNYRLQVAQAINMSVKELSPWKI